MKRSLSALSLAAVAAVGLAPSAQAVTYVQVNCESGASQYFCFVSHDAVAPATIQWYINNSYVSALDNRTSSGRRGCSRGTLVDVRVVVTDATGSTSGPGSVVCNNGPWP